MIARNQPKLKTCPICHEMMELHHYRNEGYWLEHAEPGDCELTFSVKDGEYDSPDEKVEHLVRAWNHRPTVDEEMREIRYKKHCRENGNEEEAPGFWGDAYSENKNKC
jgi:hypothetical protein